MNKNQKKVIIATGILIGLMLLFPPFVHYGSNGVEVNMGFSFILDRPSNRYITGSVNILQLLTQWIGVGAVGGLLYILFKDSEK